MNGETREAPIGMLQDQIIMITGASRGIGRATAMLCAQASAHVIVTARTAQGYQCVVEEIRQSGGSAEGVLLDVTHAEHVSQAVDEVISRHQRIDGLVNCAGIIQYHTPVWQTRIEDWDLMMKVNVRGTFLCCNAVVPKMVERRSGRVVNVGSSSARMADDDLGPYTASKWAVAGYTTSLARSVRPYQVRVNGVNPGWVDTEMSRAYKPEGDKEWSTPGEIARAIFYLLTAAPRDMTGQFLDIFGS